MTKPAAPLSLGAVLAFSAPAGAMGALAVAFAVYLPQYYAGHVGLGAGAVASVFFIVRAIDILFDPAIGMAMDRTRTRFGRYRAWMMLGAPVFMLATYLAFLPPPGAGRLYMILALLGVYVGQSVINLSQIAWAAGLAPDYDERSRVFGTISFVGLIGAGVLLLLPQLSGARSSADPNLMRLMAWFMIISAPAGIALAVLRTPETVVPDRGDGLNATDLGGYWSLIRRPEVLRIVAADVCLELGPMWMSAIYLYFFQAARGFSAGQAGILLFLYVMAGLLGAPVLARLAARFGKHRTLIGCGGVFSLALIGLFFAPSGRFWIAAPVMLILGAVAIGFIILIRAMVADIGDQARLETGRQQIGLLFALLTLMQKVASTLSIALTFGLLPVIGFDTRDGAHNTPASIHGLEWLFLIGPIAFVMLGAALLIGYRLDAGRHGEIRAALDARDAAQAPLAHDL